jgi:peptidoglycan/LPS O-acetylase OafA/YrhL
VSGSWAWRPVAALGTISYSLYLIHQFNLTLVQETVSHLLPHAWEPVRMVSMLALEVLFASVFWLICERPFLNRRPPREKAAAPPASRVFEAAG